MKSKKEVIIQFLKFGIVGVLNTLIHFVCYNIAVRFGVNYLIAQTIGFLISSINGFLLNKFLVFEKKEKNNSMIVKYYIVYFASYVLFNIGLSYFYVDVLHLNTVVNIFGTTIDVLPLMTLVFSVPTNFLLSKFWVYK